MTTTTLIPELAAYPSGDGLRAWCAHCRCWHYHGSGYGHRVAHCHRPGSPYARTGYMLTRPSEETP